MPRRAHEPVDDRALARLVDDAHVRQARQDPERQVLAHRHVWDDPVGLAVLAAVADAERDRLGWLARRNGAAAQFDLSGVGRIGAEDRARDFGAAGAEQARETDDLAVAHLDAGVAHFASDLKPFGREHDVARRGVRGGKSGRMGPHGFQVAPQHRRDEMQLVDIGHRGSSSPCARRA